LSEFELVSRPIVRGHHRCAYLENRNRKGQSDPGTVAAVAEALGVTVAELAERAESGD
jgi:hypothetical protein